MNNLPRPHILYVLTKLELGGAQKVCLSLLKNLPNHDIQTSLLSGTSGPLVSEAKKHESVFLIDSLKREVGIRSLLSEFKTFLNMIRIMKKLKKKHKNIIIHTHSTKAGILGRWAAFFAGIKKRVHTVHGYGFHDHQSLLAWWIIWFIECTTSVITTHFVCVSNKDRQTGIKCFPRFAKKSSIIRAAVEWDTFFIPTRKSSTSTFTFGTASCLKPQKNLLNLLKAFQIVHQQLPKNKKHTTKLQIVGDGIQRPILEKWIKENNLKENIELLGWQNNISKWMHSWNVFCMSSLWEGLPCAIIEARLSKLPVISYDIAGISEVIKHGKNGFLIHAGDYKILAKHMLSLVTDEHLLSQLSSYQDNLSDFKNTAMIEQHSKLYKKLF